MGQTDFAERYGPWAIIAGGSEGIGSALAERLAAQGFNLLLVARKPVPLDAASADLRKRYATEVRTLSLDLTTAEAAVKVIDAVAGCAVGLVIYNAGADSNFECFVDRPLEESERMVMLNVMTPMRLARHFAQAMVKRGKGGIVLCSSLAGVAGRPKNAVYSATKAFVNVLAEVLWFELGKQEIDVLAAILPTVRTPAMERLGIDFNGPNGAADSDDIADEILAQIKNGPALHAGGFHQRAMHLRALPRDQAVCTMAGVAAATE